MGADEYIVRLRGLPWGTQEEDVVQFLSPCKVPSGKLTIISSADNRISGTAFVEFETESDLDAALKKHKQYIKNRYIEVYRSSSDQRDEIVRRTEKNSQRASLDAVVRLRGLPYGCSKEEVAHFFSGLQIVRNGITLPNELERPGFDAYVQFASPDILEQAMLKNREKIGHRYIEIFASSLRDLNRARGHSGGPDRGAPLPLLRRPAPYGRPDRSFREHSSRGDDFRRRDYGGGRDHGFGGPMRREEPVYRREEPPFRREYVEEDNYGHRGSRMDRDSHREDEGNSYRSRTGFSVHMRGLPFSCSEDDIVKFFSPVNPVHVELCYSPSGRSTGDADVDFASHDEALDAMKKHKEYMQNRYIELFLNSNRSRKMENSRFSGPQSSLLPEDARYGASGVDSGGYGRNADYGNDGAGSEGRWSGWNDYGTSRRYGSVSY